MKLSLIAAALAVLVVLAASGCTSPGTDGTIRLTDGMQIGSAVCAQNGISDSVLVFHSPECPACRQTAPILQQIENETGKAFEFIDITSAEGKGRMAQLSMMPDYIPAVVIKCKVYVGYKGKDEFLRLIQD
jgi:thiol-disulfide isomerase/thioredoxin